MNILFLFLPWLSVTAHGANWDALIDSNGGRSIRWGVRFEGPKPFSRNPSDSFAPASTAKVVTAAWALHRLGPNFQFPTYVRWKTANGKEAYGLQILAVGDPSWGLSELGEGWRTRLDGIARELKSRGVEVVYGDVSAAPLDPRWNQLGYPMGRTEGDKTVCYGALPRAFNVSINCASLVVRGPNDVRWAQEGMEHVQIVSDIQFGNRNAPYICQPFDTPVNYVRVCGSWKRGSTRSVTLGTSVYDTSAWVRGLFEGSLKRAGIRLERGTESMPGGLSSAELVSLSPPLAAILRPFVKNSINVIGEAIYAYLGSLRSSEGDLYRLGREDLDDYLRESGGDGFVLHDGSGLSRTSLVTPLGLRLFMDSLPGRSYFSSIWSALAVAGVDGTLRNRMKGTPAQNFLRGKTGTLNGVFNLIGFVPEGESFLGFVMVTRTGGGGGPARGNQNRVGAELARLTKSKTLDVGRFMEPNPLLYVPEHAGLDDQ
jgi:serine-type D-Ala-D-Ala carboxypeptidase/endopeptidase (penicillin-binding protein 4)